MLAIIDGDVLVYQAFKPRPKPHKYSNDEDFTCLDQADEVEEKPSETKIIRLDAEGRPIQEEEEYPYTPAEDAAYLKASWNNFQKDLDKLLGKLFCDEYVMAVKGEGCYRYDLFDDYKKQRSKHYGLGRKELVNDFVPELRKLAVYEGYAIPADGREADDLIRTWANEARRADQDYIICSIDKDLRCIPGKHYIMHYDPEKQKVLDISAEEAMRHYYEQLLKGDPVDNIPGVPRVGEVKAAKLISGCLTEKEMQDVVVEQYFNAYGAENWYDYFLINAKLIHIQNHVEDFFDCRHWPIIQELCG